MNIQRTFCILCLLFLVVGCSQANKDVQSFFKEPQFESRSVSGSTESPGESFEESRQGIPESPTDEFPSSLSIDMLLRYMGASDWTLFGAFRQDADYLVIIFQRPETWD